jgi:hypothetical protein
MKGERMRTPNQSPTWAVKESIERRRTGRRLYIDRGRCDPPELPTRWTRPTALPTGAAGRGLAAGPPVNQSTRRPPWAARCSERQLDAPRNVGSQPSERKRSRAAPGTAVA